jgi:hypothetical protein
MLAADGSQFDTKSEVKESLIKKDEEESPLSV